MNRLEIEPLASFNETKLDNPARFEVDLGDGKALGLDHLISNTPCLTSSYDGQANPQTVLSGDYGLEPWDDELLYPVARIDNIHGRTLEVTADRVDIEDIHGNLFHSVNIKGSNMSNPHFFRSLTAARDHIVYGLQESIVMERIIRSSQELRKAGVGTEYVFGLCAPKTFPISENPTINDKQLVTLPTMLERISENFAERNQIENKSKLEIKADMIDKFSDCHYLITYRAMDCPYRFGEISDPEKFREFREFIFRNNPDPLVDEYLRDLNPISYLMRDFVPEFASNIAKMHRAGLTHGFLSELNVTALGSIIDLDSCKGESLGLGDEKRTKSDEVRDIIYALSSIEEVIEDFDFRETSHILEQRTKELVSYYLSIDLLCDYFNERYDNPEDITSTLAQMMIEWETTRKELEPHIDIHGIEFLRFAERITGAYRKLSDRENHVNEIDPKSFLIPRVNRLDTPLKPLPAFFFAENKEKILDHQWTIDLEKHKVDSINGNEANPMVKGMVKNIALTQIVKDANSSEDIQAYELLEQVSLTLDLLTENYNFAKGGPQWDKHHVAMEIGAFVSSLAENDMSYFSPATLRLLSGDLSYLQNRLGLIQLIDEKKSNAEILYVDSPEESRAILLKLESEKDVIVHYIHETESGLSNALAEFHQNGFDNLFLVPYEHAQLIAEENKPDEVFQRVFSSTLKSETPVVVISGIHSLAPQVFYFDFRNTINYGDRYRFKALAELEAFIANEKLTLF